MDVFGLKMNNCCKLEGCLRALTPNLSIIYLRGYIFIGHLIHQMGRQNISAHGFLEVHFRKRVFG